MKNLILLLSISLCFSASAQNLKDSEDSLSYAVGIMMGDYFKKQGIEKLDYSIIAVAWKAVLENEEKIIDVPAANEIFKKELNEVIMQKSEKTKREGEEFLANNIKRKEVKVTTSGLQYEIIKEGEGEGEGGFPKLGSTVKTHYHGTFINGEVFDSSVERGTPAEFKVNGVISGWTEALQLMKPGSKWKIYLPYNLAYGERGNRGIPPYSCLIFEIELIEISQ